MVFFRTIWPTIHFLEQHDHEMSWEGIVHILLTTKNPRKKGSKFEIETEHVYILFEIVNGIAYVINAKRRK
ncbi:MAG: hypothetical protein ABIH34_01915 [Nanoarchaeota archaeon]